MTELRFVLDTVFPDVKLKYERYSAGEPKTLSFAGFKYLIKSSPGLELDDAVIGEAFVTGAGDPSAQKSGKLNFDQFIVALRFFASKTSPDKDASDKSLLHFIVNYLAPSQLDSPDVVRALGLPSTQTAAEILRDSGAALPLPSPPKTTKPSPSPIKPPSPAVPHATQPPVIPPLPVPLKHEQATPEELVRSASVASKMSPPKASNPIPLVSTAVRDFLGSLRLQDYVLKLASLGVERMEDLRDLTGEDLANVGFKPLHSRRLLEAVAQWTQELRQHATQGISTESNGHVTLDRRNSGTLHLVGEAPEKGSANSARDEWEEYVTADNYIYYYNVRTGKTQWQRPDAGVIKSLRQRHEEQLAIAAQVEERVAVALARSRTTTPASFIPPADGPTKLADANDALPPIEHQPQRTGPPPHREPGFSQAAWREAWTDVLDAAPSRWVSEKPGSSASSVLDAALRAHEAITAGWSSPPSGHSGGTTPASASPKPYLESQTHLAKAAKEEGMAYNTYTGLSEPAPTPHKHSSADGLNSPPGYLNSYLSQQRTATRLDLLPRSNVLGVTVAGDASAAKQYLGPAAPKSNTTPGRYKALPEKDNATAITDSKSMFSHASAMYPELYEALPSMDEKTFAVIARANSVANSKIMGYSDPRPDVRPALTMMPAARSPRERLEARSAMDFYSGATGAQGKADGIWAAQLRPHLYSAADDPKAARTGEEYRRTWRGDGLAPSDVVSGYAYRHAAAASIMGDAGNVYDRLTDVRGYTGTHRHRFDESGRGLGFQGRDNSYDYQRLVESVPVEASKGAPPLPVYGDFATRTAGAAAR